MIDIKSVFWKMPYSIRQKILRQVRKEFYEKNKTLFSNSDKYGITYKKFKELKCLFIHIPKTGGISLSKTILNSERSHHESASSFQLYLSKKEFNEYFKFTIARNPWDRLVSAYFFLKKGGITENDKKFASQHLNEAESFEIFVKKHLHKQSVLNYIHFKPQHKFICDYNGRLLVDYIGRFEDYDNSYKYILDKLGLPAIELKRENVNTSKLHYKDYYTDETISIVSDIYQKDIELLQYKF